MGLKFCNEAIMSLAQLYPPYYPGDRQELTTPFQDVLVKRFHPDAHAFTMTVTPLAPPSVQLVPAKEYNGAPIGTSYDIRVYVAERPDEKLTRKMQLIRMGIRVIQGANTIPPPKNSIYDLPSATESSPGTRTTSPLLSAKSQLDKKSSSAEDKIEIKAGEDSPIPHAVVEKQFLLTDGRVRLEASLDRATYNHGDSITVQINVTNNSNKSIKRIEMDNECKVTGNDAMLV
ncbi:PREDICTED: beta-arrestin-1-like [Ceratosolen solmsi marchali]|uniref:Beta-arrestin-1-like n=1 Tax=Ceratosolen solmsi marchali TaxID=326594 RepID=A0AAJ6YYC8_9HYME|nr:PREDICTED: beta-arrestin-1-like [Ceratosolen solmsi marchali]